MGFTAHQHKKAILRRLIFRINTVNCKERDRIKWIIRTGNYFNFFFFTKALL